MIRRGRRAGEVIRISDRRDRDGADESPGSRPIAATDADPRGCESAGCFLPSSRRRFLRDAFVATVGALVAAGANASEARAMPLAFTRALGGSRNTKSYVIPAADGAQIDKDNDMILARWHDVVYAFNLSCPHQNTALRWEPNDSDFQCPKHHSRFQPDGTYIEGSGRATRAMDRLGITRAGANVVVDLDQLYQQDTDEAQWTAAIVKLT
jgi:nitrite reductase/ring-hydroxylating ferredoxin subunit